LGNWKNYDELEDQLSVDELLATLNAQRKVKYEEQKFLAMIQGIDISDSDRTSDITDLKGANAVQQGFGVGVGLGHSVMEVVES
jgi:hypothetical protein